MVAAVSAIADEHCRVRGLSLNKKRTRRCVRLVNDQSTLLRGVSMVLIPRYILLELYERSKSIGARHMVAAR